MIALICLRPLLHDETGGKYYIYSNDYDYGVLVDLCKRCKRAVVIMVVNLQAWKDMMIEGGMERKHSTTIIIRYGRVCDDIFNGSSLLKTLLA